jgi:Arm DNA-binding domain
VPGLDVRTTDRGHKSYVLGARFPGSKNFVRRELGEVGALSLADARAKARAWLLLIKEGKDPKRERVAAQRAADNTFRVIAEEFIRRKLPSQRKGARVAHEIRRELIPAWGALPVTEIGRRDVVELIEKIVDRPAPAYARNIYGHVKVLFDWIIARNLYGIEHSPTDRLKSVQIIGQRKPRERVLNDDEIRALWAAGVASPSLRRTRSGRSSRRAYRPGRRAYRHT